MQDDAVKLVQLRNEFYRDNYRRIFFALLIMIAVNVVLSLLVFYQVTHSPSPKYFAVSSEGKITKLYALSEPVVGPNSLLQWANEVAVSAFSYDFVHYREDLQTLQNKFTSDGWQNFQQAIKNAGTLDTVITKKLVLSAVATGAPVILDQGVVSGSYTWRVSLPLLVTYQSPTETTEQSLVVTMTISRVSITNNPDGIAIVMFVASERALR